MNIRELVNETGVAGYYKDITKYGWFDREYKDRVYVPYRREITRTLQWLDPEDKKWKDIPRKYECILVPAPKE